jgi:hypothetical protein
VGKKIGSFGFLRLGLWVGKNQMCLFARWLFQHGIQRIAAMKRGGVRRMNILKHHEVYSVYNTSFYSKVRHAL